ncbi:MAG: VCBS repeat-containing protein [Prevotella sp.]|nr:VCBS repeat-containing protein [Prevotella sp.]
MKHLLLHKILLISLFVGLSSTSNAQKKIQDLEQVSDIIIEEPVEPWEPEEPGEPGIPFDPKEPFVPVKPGRLTPTVDPANPDIPSVSNSYTVGSSAGSLMVNGSGAATYNLAISCPNGGSLTPQISLAYSSQNAGYGLAGYGFTVTGLSSITRGEKTLFNNNGSIKGVTYTNNDHLFLDGKRMILKSGSACQEGAIYCLEGDPYTKIITHDAVNSVSVSIWFEVKTADGKTYRYGNIPTGCLSYKNKKGNTHIAAWYLNKVEDVYGNYISYGYSSSNLYVYLNSITYGVNSNKSRGITNKIVFEYQSLGSNSSTFNIEDQQGKIEKCISTITTYTGSTVYRKYQLTYNSSSDGSTNKFTRLTQIQELNGSGESLTPVQLTWNYLPSRTASYSQINVPTKDGLSYVEEQDKSFFAADLNGDGVSDIIRIAPVKINNYDLKNHVYISRSSVSSTGSVSYLDPIVFTMDGSFSIKDWSSTLGSSTLMDFDGDGYNDIIIPQLEKIDIASLNISRVFFYVILGSDVVAGKGGEVKTKLIMPQKDKIPLLVTFDTDGNGKDNMVFVEQNKKDGKYPAAIAEMKDNTEFNIIEFTLNLSKDPNRLFCADYNNDGLTDIILLYEGGYKIYFNNGGTETSQKFTESNSKTGTSLEDIWRIQQGDIDGDGLIDFVYCKPRQTYLWVARNNGDGTFNITQTDDIGVSDGKSEKDDDKFSITVWDIDHDGKSDVTVCKAEYKKNLFQNKYLNTHVKWLYSNGTTLKLVKSTTKSREDDAKESSIFLGDFDGDGNMELANYGSNLNSTSDTFTENKLYVYRNSSDLTQTGKITRIVDGMGNRTDIRYASGTNPAVYTKTASATNQYPVNTYTLPTSLVRSVTSTNGAAGSQTVEYAYKDLKIHVAGAGVLGFAETSKNNTTTGEKAVTSITAWDQSRWIPTETKVINTVGGKTSTTISTNTVESVDKTYFAYESGSQITDIDGNTATTVSHYDKAKGVILDQTVKNDGDNMYKKVVYSGYQSKSGMWLPTVMTMTQKHKDDSSPYSTETRYTYDDKGNVLTTTVNYGAALALKTTATYDVYGNCLSSVSTGSGVKNITQYNNYDSSGRFVVKSYTNPAAAVNTFTYDIWGNVLTENDETDPSNILTTTHAYDNWGRRVSSQAPDGTKTTSTTGWGSSDSKKYYILETASESPWVLTWYDNAGHEVLQETFGPKNVLISKSTSYNSKGLVSKIKSVNGKLSFTESLTYDAQGRLLSDRVIPDNQILLDNTTGSTSTQERVISYSYGNRSVTTTVAGRSSTKTTDAWGNVLTSTDPAGSIVKYVYKSNGSPARVTSNGTTTTMTYDDAGNQTSLTDPDAGTTTYTYAANGNILKQTDAKGVETINTYDNLGRLSKVQIGGNTIVNTYGTSGNEKLRLTKSTMGGNSVEYTHDKYGRILTEKRNISGKGSYTFAYQYDNRNRLAKTTYPGNLEVTYQYDDYGVKTQTTAGGKVIYKLEEYDGLSLKMGFLNKFHINRTKDTYGFETKAQLTQTSASQNGNMISIGAGVAEDVIDQHDVNYDPITGNLLARKRLNHNVEVFGYDNLDRLTSVSNSTAQSVSGSGSLTKVMSITYAANGNILSKTGLGAYTYNSSLKPHAVMSVANTGGIIPSDALTTSFNDFQKIQTIEDEGTNTSMDFVYGPDLQRWYTALSKNGNDIRTTVYAGCYEKIVENGVTREFYYLDGSTIMIKQNGVFKPYLALTDNLGSILSVIGENGTKVFDASYDAWGQQAVTLNTIGLHRGYTGHEMLNEFGIINMNGRLYDPVLGRFFSPDNYVQLPDFTQSYNRYSYCLNNPLKYTDPSGELFGIDDAVIAFAVYNIASSMMMAAYNGENIWKAGGISLLSSALSFGIGEVFGTVGSFGKELLRAGAHGVSSGLISVLDGGNFGHGFAAGAISSSLGSFVKGVKMDPGLKLLSSTAIGGAASWATGGDFLTGALQGLQVGFFNHAMHDGGDKVLHAYAPEDAIDPVYCTADGPWHEMGITAGQWYALAIANKSLWGIDALGIYSTAYANSRYHKSWSGKEFWRTRSGKTYDSSILQRQPNGKYVRGVQGIRISRDIAKESVKVPSIVGKVLGGIDIGVNAANTLVDPTTGNVIKLGRSVASFFSSLYSYFDIFISLYIYDTKQIMQANKELGLPLGQGLGYPPVIYY